MSEFVLIIITLVFSIFLIIPIINVYRGFSAYKKGYGIKMFMLWGSPDISRWLIEPKKSSNFQHKALLVSSLIQLIGLLLIFLFFPLSPLYEITKNLLPASLRFEL